MMYKRALANEYTHGYKSTPITTFATRAPVTEATIELEDEDDDDATVDGSKLASKPTVGLAL